jgi:hypothetical protein
MPNTTAPESAGRSAATHAQEVPSAARLCCSY